MVTDASAVPPHNDPARFLASDIYRHHLISEWGNTEKPGLESGDAFPIISGKRNLSSLTLRILAKVVFLLSKYLC